VARVDSAANATVSEIETVCVFSPEDGDIMFLRNVGICHRVYTAPKPKRTSCSVCVIHALCLRLGAVIAAVISITNMIARRKLGSVKIRKQYQ
jgi:hypothetical protein